ncbi:hypothetical protein [Brevibacillus sp. SYSU BS000544]|uniref:hypothetical protein n=1 Tax=Brevibacillus sp. SYSU BS000544 TaxID=3416443 RepID=UPI003CE50906
MYWIFGSIITLLVIAGFCVDRQRRKKGLHTQIDVQAGMRSAEGEAESKTRMDSP